MVTKNERISIWTDHLFFEPNKSDNEVEQAVKEDEFVQLCMCVCVLKHSQSVFLNASSLPSSKMLESGFEYARGLAVFKCFKAYATLI